MTYHRTIKTVQSGYAEVHGETGRKIGSVVRVATSTSHMWQARTNSGRVLGSFLTRDAAADRLARLYSAGRRTA